MKRFGMLLTAGLCLLASAHGHGARKSAPKVEESGLIKTVASAGAGSVLLDMNSVSGWNNYIDNSTISKLSVAAGRNGSALSIEYNFNDGVWLSVARQAPMDLSKYKGIKFVYRGEGSANTFEVKFEDSQNSVFGYVVEARSNPGGWTEVDVPFTELKYWWGPNSALDLKKVRLHFAVSRRDNDQGGSGKLVIGAVQAY